MWDQHSQRAQLKVATTSECDKGLGFRGLGFRVRYSRQELLGSEFRGWGCRMITIGARSTPYDGVLVCTKAF